MSNKWNNRLRCVLQLNTFLGIITIAILWSGIAFYLGKQEENALRGAQTTSDNLARVFEEHVVRVIDQADNALLALRAIYKKNDNNFDVEAARVFLNSFILQISIIGPDGILRASTVDVPSGTKMDLNDREHYKKHLNTIDDKLFVSRPVVGRASGKLSIQITRRIENADGSFDGVIVASINQAALSNFYRAIDIGEDGAIVVFGFDRIVRVSRGFKNLKPNDAYPAKLLFRSLKTKAAGFFSGPGIVDGIPRLVSYRAVEGLPLVVAVGLARDAVLAEHKNYIKSYYIGAALITGVVVLIMSLGAWRKKILYDSTDMLKATQKSLIRSQERYRLVENAVDDGIWDWNLATGECYFSEHFKRITACEDHKKPEGIDTFIELLHYADKSAFLEIVKQHIKDGTPYSVDLRIVGRNDDFKWINCRGRAIQEGESCHSRMVGTITEISERKRIQSEIEEARNNLKRAEKMAGLGHVKYIKEKDEYTWSDGVYRIMGQSPEKFAPSFHTVPDFIHPDDREHLAQYRRDVMAGHSVARITFRAYREDGEEIFIKYWAVPVRGEGGCITGMFGTIQDVTEGKHFEEALKSANRELIDKQYAIDQALCFVSADVNGNITYANEKFCHVSGYSREALIGNNHRILNSGFHPPQFFEQMYKTITKGHVWRGEICNKRTDESLYWMDTTIVPQLGKDEKPIAYMAIRTDITSRKKAEEKISYLARHDTLTGLGNRAFLNAAMDKVLRKAQRRQETFGVFLLDLDGFKDVNDTLGHAAGDELLKLVACRLKAAVGSKEILARLGGDEFAIIQSCQEDQREAASGLAIRILDGLAAPFELKDHSVFVGASIGVAVSPQDGADPGELLQKADLALYRVKAEGRNNFRFFDEAISDGYAERLQLGSDLRRALGNSELQLYYQPVIDVNSREICCVEALVRWNHPEKGLLTADQFVPLAEEMGLAELLANRVLKEACLDGMELPEHIKIAVNLSATQFRNYSILESLRTIVSASEFPARRLEVEITESALMKDTERCNEILREIKNLGISIALDDFGTGYSSLSYLTKFPFDKIKIDKSFIHGLRSNPGCTAIVASVLTLARALNIVVTAEGIEEKHQFELLAAAGVQQVQGYLFGRPEPIEDMVSRFMKQKLEITTAA